MQLTDKEWPIGLVWHGFLDQRIKERLKVLIMRDDGEENFERFRKKLFGCNK